MSGDTKARMVERARVRCAGLVRRRCPECRRDYLTPRETEEAGVEDVCPRCREAVESRKAATKKKPWREAKGVRAVEPAGKTTSSRGSNGRHL